MLSTKEIRNKIKEDLGYNTKQVSVRKEYEGEYIVLTIRDVEVDTKAIHSFSEKLSGKDQTLYVVYDDDILEEKLENIYPNVVNFFNNPVGEHKVCDDIFLTIDGKYLYIKHKKGIHRVWIDFTNPKKVSQSILSFV